MHPPGKEVSHKKLQNTVMQLRLACNTPHLFSWPWSTDSEIDSTLITASGKISLLERLVPPLLSSGHKIIIFSQFSKQLDILQDWAIILHSWPCFRIDGSVKSDDRQSQIEDFNSDPECRIFLLSTRAGGLGINLTAADTVILFDSDWNPQQDLQAQDRVHRIGQTKPVIIYRLASKGTVEESLLDKAYGKRRLEKLVIQKDKFRSLPGSKQQQLQRREHQSKNLAAAAATTITDNNNDHAIDIDWILQNDDFENYEPLAEGEEVLSDEDLRILMDRSDAAFLKSEKGMAIEGDKFRTVETKAGMEDILGGL